jgi:uncharacterized membrane protein YvlD (DUF360 family)
MLSSMRMLFELAIRTLVFGVAITFVVRRDPHVKVTPRSALPVVALVFAILNALLYKFLGTALNIVTLWTLFLLVPFVANAILLLITDKLVKPFKIEAMSSLLKASLVVTIAHLALRLAHL